jgi:hypothetical protein
VVKGEETASVVVALLLFMACMTLEPVQIDIEIMTGKGSIKTVVEEFVKVY